MCKNLNVKSNGHSTICIKQANDRGLGYFLTIKEIFENLHPGSNAVPNDECPFWWTGDMDNCPLFEPSVKQS